MTALRHVAIIMDGNGRWAKGQLSSRKDGHIAGAKTVPYIINRALEINLDCLTLFAFSCENWARPADEVANILDLIEAFVINDLQSVHDKNISIKVLGRRDNLSPSLIKLLDQAENTTMHNNGLKLNIAFNYSGRDDIIRAVNKLVDDNRQRSANPSPITEQQLSRYLDTAHSGDPDLIIRTSGEMRLSNFLLWQAAYAELYFCDCYWPNFNVEHFNKAVEHYRRRVRTFGRLDAGADAGEV